MTDASASGEARTYLYYGPNETLVWDCLPHGRRCSGAQLKKSRPFHSPTGRERALGVALKPLGR